MINDDSYELSFIDDKPKTRILNRLFSKKPQIQPTENNNNTNTSIDINFLKNQYYENLKKKSCKFYINCFYANRLKNILYELINSRNKIVEINIQANKIKISMGFKKDGYISSININGIFKINNNNELYDFYKDICIKSYTEYNYCKRFIQDIEYNQKYAYKYNIYSSDVNALINKRNSIESINIYDTDFCKILITCDNYNTLKSIINNTTDKNIILKPNIPLMVRIKGISRKLPAEMISLDLENYSFNINYVIKKKVNKFLNKYINKNTTYHLDQICITNNNYTMYNICTNQNIVPKNNPLDNFLNKEITQIPQNTCKIYIDCTNATILINKIKELINIYNSDKLLFLDISDNILVYKDTELLNLEGSIKTIFMDSTIFIAKNLYKSEYTIDQLCIKQDKQNMYCHKDFIDIRNKVDEKNRQDRQDIIQKNKDKDKELIESNSKSYTVTHIQQNNPNSDNW